MLNALITGIDGFVGGHLATQLMETGNVKISGTTFFPTENHQHLIDKGIQLWQVDLKDPEAVARLVGEVKPDQIYHLAAQSSVSASFDGPWDTLENNIRGQLNLLQSLATKKLGTRVLIVGSGEEYGIIRPEDLPIGENQPLRPANPYSVSKVAQDVLGYQYFIAHGIQTIRVRPFNHTGPGQSKQFVVPAFASQIAAIERGLQPNILKVGNLAAERDISDVRDVVRAYELAMSRGVAGDVYNVGQDRAVRIQTVLDTLISMSNAAIEVQVDPDRFRPIDVPIIVGNSTRLRDITGWAPSITLEQTLTDILAYWRMQPDKALN